MEELNKDLNTQIESVTDAVQTENAFNDLPRLEDLMKSEKEVKPAKQIEGVTQVGNSPFFETKSFSKKEDKKNIRLKKRVKIVTGVYLSVVTLLLAFVIVNSATLAVLNKSINANTNTIQSKNDVVQYFENTTTPEEPMGIIEVSLNEPRDYSDDKKELTFLDKLTIIFRNIFA